MHSTSKNLRSRASGTCHSNHSSICRYTCNHNSITLAVVFVYHCARKSKRKSISEKYICTLLQSSLSFKPLIV